MSQDTADIVGAKGSSFSITISAGMIVSAYLEVINQSNVPLAIEGSSQAVTIPSLPAGDSKVRLDLGWKPGDPNATVRVAPVIPGAVATAHPNLRLDDGDTPGFFNLFGT
jgi:hypothetical protein